MISQIQFDQRRIMHAASQPTFTVLEMLNRSWTPEQMKAVQLCHDLIKEEAYIELCQDLRNFQLDPSVFNLELVYDGAIDTVVVIMQLLNTLGLSFADGWKEVQHSNESKIRPDGTVEIDSKGKWIKPLTFTKPDMIRLISNAIAAAPSPQLGIPAVPVCGDINAATDEN